MISGLDTETVIEPDIKHNSKEENTNSQNVYISGDNIDALKHLVKTYQGKIKCIYSIKSTVMKIMIRFIKKAWYNSIK